jgi:hypothetical protein
MSNEELARASRAIMALLEDIAADQPEAARVLLDAGDLIGAELLARAFGGSRRARKFARDHVAKERARQDH